MKAIELPQLTADLKRFAAKQFGDGASVEDVRAMESGHAGLTFGFDVARAEGSARAGFVIRLAPIGVTRRGNTDVYRQAPLLKALHAAGLPVPRVPYSSPGEEDFGTPYIIMEKLPGRTLFICEPDAAFDLWPDAVRPLWLGCAAALASFHRFDWRTSLAGWDEPRSVSDELLRWDRIIDKAPDPAAVDLARQTRASLLESVPASWRVGLVHGDFQPGNTLYDDGEITGVIDWELTSIGEIGLDIGWLMMLSDSENWIPEWHPISAPHPDEIKAAYEQALGAAVPNLAWYRALAGYKLGVISGMNLYLHRSGKRHDPVWEHYGAAAPNMFRRAGALLRDSGR